MSGKRMGWFADWDDERNVAEYGWQPCFETGEGHVPCFEFWFKTKAECEEWIAAHVIGAGWSPGSLNSPPVPGARLIPPVGTKPGETPGTGYRTAESDRALATRFEVHGRYLDVPGDRWTDYGPTWDNAEDAQAWIDWKLAGRPLQDIEFRIIRVTRECVTAPAVPEEEQ